MATHLSALSATARPADRALRSPLRWWAAVLLVVTAGAHVPVIGPHLEEAPYIGVLLVLLTAGSIILAAVLVIRDTRTAWTLAGTMTLLAVIAFVLARTVGLPQIGDDIGDWTDPWGIVSITVETLTFLLAGEALLGRRRKATVPAAANAR
jgi:hypothetical protein